MKFFKEIAVPKIIRLFFTQHEKATRSGRSGGAIFSGASFSFSFVRSFFLLVQHFYVDFSHFIYWMGEKRCSIFTQEMRREKESESKSERQSNTMCACVYVVCGAWMTTNGKICCVSMAAKPWDSSQMILLATVYKSNNHTHLFSPVCSARSHTRYGTHYLYLIVSRFNSFRSVCETIT